MPTPITHFCFAFLLALLCFYLLSFTSTVAPADRYWSGV